MSNGVGAVTNDAPSALSCAAHRTAGAVDPPSLDFHVSHAAPVAGSTNGWASIDPPSAGWQYMGPGDVSVKIGLGLRLDAVAMLRQLCPVPAAKPASDAL